MRVIGDRIAEYAEGPGGSDYKTRLQELAAREFEQLPPVPGSPEPVPTMRNRLRLRS